MAGTLGYARVVCNRYHCWPDQYGARGCHCLFKHDLKALLAFSTVSHLGLITMLLGMGTAFGAMAAMFHILNHATFKAALFMSAGIVDHETLRATSGAWAGCGI